MTLRANDESDLASMEHDMSRARFKDRESAPKCVFGKIPFGDISVSLEEIGWRHRFDAG